MYDAWRIQLRNAFVDTRAGYAKPDIRTVTDHDLSVNTENTDNQFDTILEDTLSNIILSQLSRLDPTSRYAIKQYFEHSIGDLRRTHADIPDSWLCDARYSIENEDVDLYGTQSLGECFIGSTQPVSVWIPVILLGALAIAYHAKLALNDLPPLQIHAGLPDALAIVARASGGWEGIIPPELIVTGDAPSLRMSCYDYGQYHIRTSMPPCEQKIVVSNNSKIDKMGSAYIPTKLKLSELSVSTPQVHMTKLFENIDWMAGRHLGRISFNIEPRFSVSEILSRKLARCTLRFVVTALAIAVTD